MSDDALAILITLIIYKIVLLGLGYFARARTHNAADFYLGGRRLGPLVAAISASASSSSVWTLLGVSGYAFKHGLSAMWLFPGCVGGFALNWYILAPRLRRTSAESGALTLTEVLAGPPRQGRRAIVIIASVIILFCLLTYVTNQIQGAGRTFEKALGFDFTMSVLLGSAIVVSYTMLGGFWAVSLTDTLQGLLMAVTAIVLPIMALVAAGGPTGLAEKLTEVQIEGYVHLGQNLGGAAAMSLVLALLGIGLGYPGQPHVVNRFMALRDDLALAKARRYAMGWAVCVYGGMILLGLCGQVLLGDRLNDHEDVFIGVAKELLSPIVAGIMVAAVLSAIMSTADSQLLVAASTVTHDLDVAGTLPGSKLRRGRAVVLLLTAGAVIAALSTSPAIFGPVLFAWSAMGAAFGPLLLVTVFFGPVPVRATLRSICSGFVLSVLAYADFIEIGGAGTRGTAYERLLPFFVALAFAIEPTLLRRRSDGVDSVAAFNDPAASDEDIDRRDSS